jgi:hypothetical protein
MITQKDNDNGMKHHGMKRSGTQQCGILHGTENKNENLVFPPRPPLEN